MTSQPIIIHIIAFDIPWPANYGGVIDVFYKLRWLQQEGLKIILHCYRYGRDPAQELNDLCEEVHYYARNTGLAALLSSKPYIVRSRTSATLKRRLLQDNYPILCEGLHCTSFLASPLFHNRAIYVRATNVEHHYYHQLAKKETNLIRKFYYKVEAFKLRYYEKVLHQATGILAISPADKSYFEKRYGLEKVTGIYAFHPHDKVQSKTGSGDYYLFHGRLDVPENYHACIELLPLFKGWTGKPLRIAGMNPPSFLVRKVLEYPTITLTANPTADQMDELVAGAHAHLLFTHQSTGLKLKLLSALFQGRFVVVNDKMVNKTGLETLCIVANTGAEILKAMTHLESMAFEGKDIIQRQNILEEKYSNKMNAQKLLALLSGVK